MSRDVTVTGRQERTIVKLLSESSVEAAAQAAGVSARTLWRWFKDPIFSAAYRRARKDAVSQAIARLQQVAGDAVEALQAVTSNQEAPAPARVSAAKAIIELAVKAVEVEDLEARIAALEEKTAK